MTDTILDTPTQLELFHLLQMKYALKIEIGTRLRHSRGSVLKLVNNVLNTNHRTKQAALDALEKHIDEITARITGDPA
jgi:hypothetical protein